MRPLLLLALLLVCGAAGAQDYRVFVTNETAGTLSVIDPAQNGVVATVALGKRPRGLRLSPDGKLLYVALSGSPIGGPSVDESKLPPPDKTADGIGVVDVNTLKLVRMLRGVSDPEQLDVSVDGREVFVASEDAAQLVALDTATGAVVVRLKTGPEPEGVTVSPDGTQLLVTSEAAGDVMFVNTKEHKALGAVAVGARPRACAYTPDGVRAFCSGEADASVSVLDARSRTLAQRIHLDDARLRPMGVVMAKDGAHVYVSTGRGGSVVAIDTRTLAVSASAKAGQRPWGLALSPDGTRLYSANGPSDDVSVIDTATLKTIATIASKGKPWGVTVVPR